MMVHRNSIGHEILDALEERDYHTYDRAGRENPRIIGLPQFEVLEVVGPGNIVYEIQIRTLN